MLYSFEKSFVLNLKHKLDIQQSLSRFVRLLTLIWINIKHFNAIISELQIDIFLNKLNTVFIRFLRKLLLQKLVVSIEMPRLFFWKTMISYNAVTCSILIYIQNKISYKRDIWTHYIIVKPATFTWFVLVCIQECVRWV